jgi:hypothetical protein
MAVMELETKKKAQIIIKKNQKTTQDSNDQEHLLAKMTTN